MFRQLYQFLMTLWYFYLFILFCQFLLQIGAVIFILKVIIHTRRHTVFRLYKKCLMSGLTKSYFYQSHLLEKHYVFQFYEMILLIYLLYIKICICRKYFNSRMFCFSTVILFFNQTFLSYHDQIFDALTSK